MLEAPAPDPTMLAVTALAALLYGLGVRRLGARGRRWPAARTAAFAAGLLALTIATSSGLARVDTVRFSAHAVQHVLLGMVAPLLLALGAPVTLALQAAARPTRSALLRVVDHPAAGALTHPAVGWALFGGTLFALYLTPVFGLSLRNDLVHAAVHLHFLAAGCLFFWPLVGTDPVRRRLPHPARMLSLLLLVPVHAVLGLALLGLSAPLGDGTWSLADQRAGAAVLWGTGDLLGLVAGGVVLARWMAADDRAQAVRDRLADAGRR
ncbi:MAG TPA: cytochrome c oxidase assembly protein [Acidimicrobiales bacterium]|jgi:putative copper resistance protein D